MERREVLLVQATLFFKKYGYRGVSFNDIIKQSKLSKGGYLHYYASKEILFAAVFTQVLNDINFDVEELSEPILQTYKQLIKWKFEFENVLEDIQHQPLKQSLLKFSNKLKNVSSSHVQTIGIFLINNSYTKSNNFKNNSTKDRITTSNIPIKPRTSNQTAEDLVFVQDE